MGGDELERREAGPPPVIRRDRSAIDSRDLFAHTREITILHDDAQYRLRLTSNNKLILTK